MQWWIMMGTAAISFTVSLASYSVFQARREIANTIAGDVILSFLFFLSFFHSFIQA